MRSPYAYHVITPAKLRTARLAAGITQRELAAAVGIAPSNLSAYEAGRRPMSAEMAERIEAAIRPLPHELVDRHRGRMREMLQAAGVRHPRIFGSVARREDTRESDVDIVVDLGETITGFGLAALQLELEDLLGVPVELVSSGSLEGRFRDRVLRDAVAL